MIEAKVIRGACCIMDRVYIDPGLKVEVVLQRLE